MPTLEDNLYITTFNADFSASINSYAVTSEKGGSIYPRERRAPTQLFTLVRPRRQTMNKRAVFDTGYKLHTRIPLPFSQAETVTIAKHQG